jgi:hypothetical protein
MNINLRKYLLAFTMALGLVAFSGSADAGCRWVSGYYSHGYYHHSHRVCWANNYNNFNRHCGWRHGHRVCW